MAFIATNVNTGETMGVVRAITDSNNHSAEFAIIIRTDWQGRGLGTALLRKIIRYCQSRGTGKLYGHILQGNHDMLVLAEQLGFELDYSSEDSVVIATLPLKKLHE
ncbi:MAG: GNAT family N-acetyltransferase [Gammaproteobacteria bacterium]